MRFTRVLLNTSLALSLPLISYGQTTTTPVIPRAKPAQAPLGQPALEQPATRQPAARPAQIQPGQPQLQPGQPLQLQPNRSPATVTANKPVTGVQANQNANQQIASLLAICNQKEVKLAELAKNKSENKDVKEFAEMLIKDHTDMLGKLNQFGGHANLGITGSSEHRDQTAEKTRTNTPPNRTSTGASEQHSSAQHGLDFVAVHREAAQMCLNKAQKKWSEQKSAECDMAYIGSQVVAHEELINHAKALRQYASPELQTAIDQGITAAEKHRDAAYKLIKQLSDEENKKS